jgi:hypothetical protein
MAVPRHLGLTPQELFGLFRIAPPQRTLAPAGGGAGVKPAA